MRKARRFMRDERGTTFEGIALSVSIVAVAFVASADMLDYMTKTRHQSPMGEFAAVPHASTLPVMAGGLPAGTRATLDDTPTASLPSTLPKMIMRSVLDPCTGATK